VPTSNVKTSLTIIQNTYNLSALEPTIVPTIILDPNPATKRMSIS